MVGSVGRDGRAAFLLQGLDDEGVERQQVQQVDLPTGLALITVDPADVSIVVVAGAIVITQGQRRIPIQQAKHTRGRRVYGGQKAYLPLRVNHGGVMPIIFASSLMIFPSMLFGYLQSAFPENVVWDFMAENFSINEGGFLYVLAYIGLIYFFAYFWTTVQFQPKEMATNLRDHGSFIPALRPGPRTADYLEKVMVRIAYVGAGFLTVVAIVPTIISGSLGVSFAVASFYGGTGLLIAVSVAFDLVQKIDSHLVMRNYRGLLESLLRTRLRRLCVAWPAWRRLLCTLS